MGEESWVLYLLGGGGGASILITIINKFRNTEQKGVDVMAITKQITDAFTATMSATTDGYNKVIQLTQENLLRTEERIRDLELKIEEKNVEKEDYRMIISSTHDCSLLRENPKFECPVVKGSTLRSEKKCTYLRKEA